jgi:aldose 1-epimerase
VPIELAHGGLSLGLLPEAGGVMLWLAQDGIDLLRRADIAAVRADPTMAACFPLFPYSGPVVGGAFRFAGREHRLARNHPHEPEPVHGEGWVAAWEVIEQGIATATLRYRHDPAAKPGSFPFAYAAEQRLALTAGTLSVRLSLANLGAEAMPAGLGLHPYFPDRSGLTLDLRATAMWSRTPVTAADPLGAVPAAFRFDPPRHAGALVVDDCFAGWGGRTVLSWPERGVTLALEAAHPLDFVQLYALADDDFLCVEPVSNANDGFNLLAAGVAGHGVRVLGPGERLEGEVRLSLL